MDKTLHITAVVLPGGRIVVEGPDLSEGDEVLVAVTPVTAPAQRSAAEIIADSPGKRSFRTAEEADEYIRQERNSWRS